MKKIISLSLLAAFALSSVALNPLSGQAAVFTASQVAQHNTTGNCWLIISGKVYDVTSYIPSHPGGTAIVPYCGQDATSVFASEHNSGTVNLLPPYLIGDLALPLTAPVITGGTSTQNSATINWAGSTGGVSPITYTILRNAISVGTTTLTTFNDTGLTASTTYSYVVRATDSATSTPSVVSSAAFSITTLSTSTPIDATPPTAPTGLAISNVTASSLTLSWNASADANGVAGYKVFRNSVQIATTTSASFNNSGLAPLTAYSYAVSAFDPAGNVSALSNSVTTTTLALPAPATSTISIVSPANGSTVSNKILVSVNISGLSNTAKKIKLYVDGKKAKTKNLKNATSTYAFKWNTKGSKNGNHTLQVKAYDSAGNVIATSGTTTIIVNNVKKKNLYDHWKDWWENNHRNDNDDEDDDD